MTSFEPHSTREVAGWTVLEFGEVVSTNPVAGKLPAWHAVRADTQTGGRGRTGRVWVSDRGGLWLSAVVPVHGDRKRWAILPLAAGWAIIRSLERLGASGLRLRWPNDVLVGRRKLAGLLVEQFRPDTAVIGIGLNIDNRPDEQAPELAGHTVGLNALLPVAQSTASILQQVLQSVREAHREVEQNGLSRMATAMNARWDQSQRVELTLNGAKLPFEGYFRGIDSEGRLHVTSADGQRHTLDASQVALLRELD